VDRLAARSGARPAGGAGYTLVFALASMVGGLAIGVPVALMRIALLKTLRWPATLYVSLIPR
jgi:cystine transport system permease protein